ncbi:MAG: hypothetical protein JXR58_11840 [Bacteroidales bacterium]|nr:hypothetical protein [Bacteroidales bacterium]
MRNLLLLFILAFNVGLNAQEKSTSKETKTVISEKQIAKHQVIVKLEKKIDENGKEVIVSETTTIKIPESFPKYIDTGNPKKDENDYHDAKMKWIRENPEEFEKIKHLNL